MKAILKLTIVVFAVFILIVSLRNLSSKKIVTQTVLAMGTTARITIVVSSPKAEKVSSAYKAIDDAFALIHSIEKKLSFYSPESELYQVNENAAKRWVKISLMMLEVLDKAFLYSDLTQGVFDVTATSLQKEGGYGSIDLDKPAKTVRFKNKNTKIDLGGIAAGFAIDKVAEHFKSLQIDDYLIDIGGDVYAQGTNQRGEPWQVGVRNPVYQDRIIKKISIKNRAVTTSGNYVKKHIVDPNSGKLAASGLLSVSVVASNCIDADVLATAFFIMGIERTREFIFNKRNDLQVLFVVDKHGSPEVITCNWDNAR